MFEPKYGADCVAGFVNSDYAGDLDKRRFALGYVFILTSGSVSWRSMLQVTSALSTTETEYTAITKVPKEAMWLKGLVSKLDLKQDIILLRCDNQSVIYFIKNQVYHARIKHINVWKHRVLDWVNSGESS